MILTNYLLFLGANPNYIDKESNNNMLKLAVNFECRKKSYEMVDLLISAKADINLVTGYDKSSALHLAATHLKAKIAHLLLDNGADITLLDKYGKTPVQIANDHWTNGLKILKKCKQTFVASLVSGDNWQIAEKVEADWKWELQKSRFFNKFQLPSVYSILGLG